MSLENDLIQQLESAMRDIYNVAKKDCNYRPTRFLEMLGKKGAIETARHFLNSSNVSNGFTKLWECGRLDLSVEAVISKEPFCKLFTKEELKIAKKRLKEYHYESV